MLALKWAGNLFLVWFAILDSGNFILIAMFSDPVVFSVCACIFNSVPLFIVASEFNLVYYSDSYKVINADTLLWKF